METTEFHPFIIIVNAQATWRGLQFSFPLSSPFLSLFFSFSILFYTLSIPLLVSLSFPPVPLRGKGYARFAHYNPYSLRGTRQRRLLRVIDSLVA